jgi:hypothetical protein
MIIPRFLWRGFGDHVSGILLPRDNASAPGLDQPPSRGAHSVLRWDSSRFPQRGTRALLMSTRNPAPVW